MGLLHLPENLDHLAGVMGAVDGERIEALLGAMRRCSSVSKVLMPLCEHLWTRS